MKKKHVSLLLAAAMAVSVISGCGNSAAEIEKTETTAAATTSAAEETTAAEAEEDTEKTRQTKLSSGIRVMPYRHRL